MQNDTRNIRQPQIISGIEDLDPLREGNQIVQRLPQHVRENYLNPQDHQQSNPYANTTYLTKDERRVAFPPTLEPRTPVADPRFFSSLDPRIPLANPRLPMAEETGGQCLGYINHQTVGLDSRNIEKRLPLIQRIGFFRRNRMFFFGIGLGFGAGVIYNYFRR